VAGYKHQGRKVVFTNGCFDIIHSGHVSYLNQAKEQGDILIVGVNSDDSVRRLKGSGRPINPLEDRVQVLAALSSVDHIIPFDSDMPTGLIEAIRPDVYVKGGDYTLETLPEARLVKSMGGEVRLIDYVENHSTTGMIAKIYKLYAQGLEQR
jgi:D-beta-D-heptose 7-phosphate kinase/D-beta-D-heptose 1-phosphate adenosyltransferase